MTESDDYSHLEWIRSLTKTLHDSINDEEFQKSLLVSAIGHFEGLDDLQKNDIFVYLLGYYEASVVWDAN